jgi:hypothetical protein
VASRCEEAAWSDDALLHRRLRGEGDAHQNFRTTGAAAAALDGGGGGLSRGRALVLKGARAACIKQQQSGEFLSACGSLLIIIIAPSF